MKAAVKDKPVKEQPAPEPTTDLSLPERAQIALKSSETEHRLVELSSAYKSITTITNKDGREECHSALMVIRNTRTAIERTAKAAREDATKFSKAVIAEENRLIAIISDEEKRLAAIRDAWDEQKELERKAAEEAERQRVEAIQNQIRDIKAIPYQFVSASLQDIKERIELMEAEVPDPEYFGDLLLDAKIAHKESLHALRTRFTQKLLEIETAAKAEAERIALEEQRKEQGRITAEQAAAQKAIDDARTALKAEQDAIEAEKAEIIAAKQLEAHKEPDKTLEHIPEHAAVDDGQILTTTDSIEPHLKEEKVIVTMSADEIVAKVYLPTNIELYTYLHTCTMNHYGLDAKQAKQIIVDMAKAMKI